MYSPRLPPVRFGSAWNSISDYYGTAAENYLCRLSWQPSNQQSLWYWHLKPSHSLGIGRWRHSPFRRSPRSRGLFICQAQPSDSRLDCVRSCCYQRRSKHKKSDMDCVRDGLGYRSASQDFQRVTESSNKNDTNLILFRFHFNHFYFIQYVLMLTPHHSFYPPPPPPGASIAVLLPSFTPRKKGKGHCIAVIKQRHNHCYAIVV
jgi:hypothetical protein